MKLPQDINTVSLPGFEYTGVRENITAGAATSRVAIPVGSAGRWVVIRATDNVYLEFGNSAVNATSTSMMWVGTEFIYKIPLGTTHVAALRVGTADVLVQLELLLYY